MYGMIPGARNLDYGSVRVVTLPVNHSLEVLAVAVA
jgi:hypothetical protein